MSDGHDVVGWLHYQRESQEIGSDFVLIGRTEEGSRADVQISDERLSRYHVALRRFPEQGVWMIKDLCPEQRLLIVEQRYTGAQAIAFRTAVSFSVAGVEFRFKPATTDAEPQKKAARTVKKKAATAKKPKKAATKPKQKTWTSTSVKLNQVVDLDEPPLVEIDDDNDSGGELEVLPPHPKRSRQ